MGASRHAAPTGRSALMLMSIVSDTRLARGKRGPLTKEEQEEECRSWEPELTAHMDEKLRIERVRIQALLQTYSRKKRRHYAALQR
jgi:hypothetical protein